MEEKCVDLSQRNESLCTRVAFLCNIYLCKLLISFAAIRDVQFFSLKIQRFYVLHVDSAFASFLEGSTCPMNASRI